MATRSSTIAGPQTSARVAGRQGAGLTEGWVSILLHLVIMAATAATMFRVERADRVQTLIPMAVAGLVLGIVLARTRCLDVASHVIAIASGGIVATSTVALWKNGARDVWDSRGRVVYDLARHLSKSLAPNSAHRIPNDEMLVLFGLTLWLVGYSSAWMLYRRGWLVASLALPAVIVLISLRLDEGASPSFLIVLMFAASVMAARHVAHRRTLEWNRQRFSSVVQLTGWATAAGATIAAIALLAAWGISGGPSDRLTGPVTHAVQSAFVRAENAWQDAGLPSRNTLGAGSYNTFPESFKIGQELKLSDTPVASLQASTGHYLAARRWDYYDGHDWATHVDDTYRRAGGRSGESSSPISFAANQTTPYSVDVTSARGPVTGIVTMLQGNPGPALTIETFSAISEPSRAFMGWMGIDRQVAIGDVDVASLPVDLQSLVIDLQSATFEAAADGSLQIVDLRTRQVVAAKIDHLAEFPVSVRIAMDAGQHPSIRFLGRLPVYDDIEVIVPAQGLRAGDRYRVVGLGSQATREDLRSAGTGYPTWVTDRYLQLPTTVTERTRELAAQLVAEAGATTPFDQAWAIQQFLQTSFTYALNSESAPDDQDFVDYFLFTSKVGRCEQYATSMAVMLRTLGVPTRMVGGYRADGGEQDGTYLFREKQAHTWVEAYFPTFGWIPFEPTAGQDPFAYGDNRATPETTGVSTPVATVTSPIGATPPPVAPTATVAPAPAATAAEPPGSNGLGERVGGRRGIAILGAILGVSALFAIGYALWMQGLRGLSPAAALYARTRRVGRFWGIEPDATMTPYEFASEFERAAPSAAASVHVVTDLYLAEHYGHRVVDSKARSSGRLAWREVRRSVLRWRPFRRSAIN